MNRRDFFKLFTATGISVAIPGGLAPLQEEHQPGIDVNFDDDDMQWYALHMSAPDGWHIWNLEQQESAVMRQVNKPWLPCGNHNNFVSIYDIPLYDVPCPCGNPRHWLVKCVTTVEGLPHP